MTEKIMDDKITEEQKIQEKAEEIQERYELSMERIRQMQQEEFPVEELDTYFKFCTAFIMEMCGHFQWIKEGGLKKAEMAELSRKNRKLYEDILPQNYGLSYANPAWAVKKLGEDFGRMLSLLYTELRSLIGAAYEQDTEWMTIYMELFIEIRNTFEYEWQDNKKLPEKESVRQVLYWFASDYAEVVMEKRIRQQVDPSRDFAVRIIMDSDFKDLRYLYYYGEYVSENELRTARYLNSLPEEKIALMADTFSEGYRIGFQTTGKDLSIKKTVGIYYGLGFERMMRRAIQNFARMGLKPVISRPALSLLQGKGAVRQGFTGANPNKQFDYDHKDDQALILDKAYVNRRLEVLKEAYESQKEKAAGYAGPAVAEVFGETPFAPENKKEAFELSGEQQRLSVEYRSDAMEIQRRYIKEEERSYTIIAFPIPEIGENFEEIFNEIIRINTLDAELYKNIQQKLIDVLDEAEYVTVKGMHGNRTDLKVMLHELQNPEKETIFENCGADVNIPVGEVFTSPKLEGTEGILHVSKVFLNELEYKDLTVEFKDGMISGYSCANFETEEENLRFLKDNLLYHHETLPLGEFAIGTNTTAYVVAGKYGIGSKLPILIAEKMGPHFAVGDTCYSHAEEIKVYNPDGKEIISRDNTVSGLRTTDPARAYFNCHTDITIPYDELGSLKAVRKDGGSTVIIRDGRFVLPGCEELNRPFEEK